MGAAKNFWLLKINENMPFYFKNMGIMPEVFFYFNSRVGGGGESGGKVSSVPSGHAPVLTSYYNNIYLNSGVSKKFIYYKYITFLV